MTEPGAGEQAAMVREAAATGGAEAGAGPAGSLPPPRHVDSPPQPRLLRIFGLNAGPVVFGILLLLVPPPQGMSLEAWRTAATAVLMAIWWTTEAIPIPVTALLPLALFPLLGVATITEAAAPYASPIIFLFLGGFVIALALQRSGLHRRLALTIIRAVGNRPVNLVAGFMLATAFLSMWVSNTATVALMLPVALSVIGLAQSAGNGDPRLPVAMLLGIAYAASIGGVGTLIGTPPNALLAGFMSSTYGVQIGFAQWMLLGVPLVAVALPACWLLLVRVVFPLRNDPITGGRRMIRHELQSLGRLSRAEFVVGGVTTLVALAWIFQPALSDLAPGLSDAGIAIGGVLLLFLVPIRVRRLEFAIGGRDLDRLPWGVLLLFGGGLSLAGAIQATGLADWVNQSLGGLHALPILVVSLVVTTVIIFLTEFTSNTATAAAFLPVAASLALGMGVSPMLLAIPTAIGASCAFMMPVATPPNAIIFGSDQVGIRQMMRAGFWLNLLLIGLINAAVFLLAGRVFGF
jgi:solute carrier family 13 (sodium-dependent dicarboxylate transporter), member 2/3/5